MPPNTEAMTGNTEILHGLFQRDSLILKRFTLSSFSETPLHISVLAGHLDFTRELLRMNPGMATEVDSSNATPLHLASAPGHTEIVKALLNADSDACLVRDEDCRIPLHLAVIRGRVRIIQELVLARPESVLVKLDGDTVLHLCVRYNHLEALELLVQLINGDKSSSSSIICLGDQDGNTVLHLAVMLKQLQTTSYLVSLNSMGLLSVNCLNGHGSTALDCLELCPKDYKSLQIRDLLVVAGGRQVGAASSRLPLPPSSSLPSNNEASKTTTKCCNSICRKLKKLFAQDKNWVEERRETMLLVATILASMSFQSVINPPGGVWDDDNKDSTGCNTTNVCLAGTAIFESRDPGQLRLFMQMNTIAFAASLSIILLSVGGFPIKNRFLIWLLAIATCVSLTFMIAAYVVALLLVIPSAEVETNVWGYVGIVWVLLVVVIVLLNTLRLVIWICIKLGRFVIWICSKLRKGTIKLGRALGRSGGRRGGELV